MKHVELKPLRKNAVNVSYIVVNADVGGVTHKVTYYETIDEALKHSMEHKNGDIIVKGYGRLISFFCGHENKMKIGFGATTYERESLKKIWWAFN